jgi:hypothetical protein
MHAPAPWTTAQDPDGDGEYLVVDANGAVVADCGTLGRSLEEQERIASAIAALITTLEGARAAMQRVLDGRGFDTLDELAGECLQSQVDVAAAVIARATGTKPMVGRGLRAMEDSRPGRAAEGAERSEHARASARPGV